MAISPKKPITLKTTAGYDDPAAARKAIERELADYPRAEYGTTVEYASKNVRFRGASIARANGERIIISLTRLIHPVDDGASELVSRAR